MIDSTTKIPSLKIPNDKPNPTVGVGAMSWSSDSAFLATKNGNYEDVIFKILNLDNMPNVLWIWDVNNLNLKAILIQLQPIRSFTWSQNSEFLAFCTGILYIKT